MLSQPLNIPQTASFEYASGDKVVVQVPGQVFKGDIPKKRSQLFGQRDFPEVLHVMILTLILVTAETLHNRQAF